MKNYLVLCNTNLDTRGFNLNENEYLRSKLDLEATMNVPSSSKTLVISKGSSEEHDSMDLFFQIFRILKNGATFVV